MNLHEYQAKRLFSEYGIPVPTGIAVSSLTEATTAAEKLGGDSWVVKAQVHAGGRGKVGGVKVVKGQSERDEAVTGMLGSFLSTKQTTGKGLPINTLLIESLCDISRELYLSVVVDRASRRVVFMASEMGGMNIEEVAEEHPDKLLTVTVDPITGLLPYQSRDLGFAMGLDKAQVGELSRFMTALYRLFVESDASLVEINPLVVTGQGKLLALDAKVGIDDSALYRQRKIADLRDPTQEDETEYAAQQHELNYIRLDGEIGCMVNGAGLAMATMDLIKLHGGEPANFLDVGGGTTAERVAEAFKIILSDSKVKGILVNIFGGIVRCDLIAEGIIGAVKEVGITIPVVVRLEGTNVEKGKSLLQESGLAIETSESLTEAAKRIVSVVGES